MIKDGAECAVLGATAQFRKPPAQSDKQETPVLEEFWRFALNRVTHELQNPAGDEHSGKLFPPGHIDEQQRGQQERQSDERNAGGVAETVDGGLVT